MCCNPCCNPPLIYCLAPSVHVGWQLPVLTNRCCDSDTHDLKSTLQPPHRMSPPVHVGHELVGHSAAHALTQPMVLLPAAAHCLIGHAHHLANVTHTALAAAPSASACSSRSRKKIEDSPELLIALGCSLLHCRQCNRAPTRHIQPAQRTSFWEQHIRF
jgi:hypothetical protein